MNVLSFRLSLWYLSGVFILIVIVLILICIIVFDGVSSFITALFSSGTTLPISCGGGDGYDDLLVVLNIKSGVCGLGGYGFSACSLFV